MSEQDTNSDGILRLREELHDMQQAQGNFSDVLTGITEAGLEFAEKYFENQERMKLSDNNIIFAKMSMEKEHRIMEHELARENAVHARKMDWVKIGLFSAILAVLIALKVLGYLEEGFGMFLTVIAYSLLSKDNLGPIAKIFTRGESASAGKETAKQV